MFKILLSVLFNQPLFEITPHSTRLWQNWSMFLHSRYQTCCPTNSNKALKSCLQLHSINYKHWDSAYLHQGTCDQCCHGPNHYEQQINVCSPLSISPNSNESRKQSPVSRWWFGSPPKFHHLFIDPLPTFPENFMQIRLEVFSQSC